jgi:hypothetical protein
VGACALPKAGNTAKQINTRRHFGADILSIPVPLRHKRLWPGKLAAAKEHPLLLVVEEGTRGMILVIGVAATPTSTRFSGIAWNSASTLCPKKVSGTLPLLNKI